jgi:uncharacterized protein YbjT (DUF2867 family)
VGSLVVAALRGRNVPVRATGRAGRKLARLEQLGAEVRTGSLTDARFLERVFEGAQSAFLLTPVDTTAEDVNGVQYSIIDAVTSALARSTTIRSWRDLSKSTYPTSESRKARHRRQRPEPLGGGVALWLS